jgi:aspartyl/asparaginyl beta-hydroxylase (cupin superfamily)
MRNLYRGEKETDWRGNPCSQGSWNVLHLVNQGVVQERVRALCPQTFAALVRIAAFAHGCVFGNAFFSVVYPGSSIAPHCGPTNIRLRCHLALAVPECGTCQMRVGDRVLGWEEGRCIFFDDSFSHCVDVFDDCREPRVALVLDLWHPDLSASERRALATVFALDRGFKEEKL